MSLATMLSNVGSFITQAIVWMGQFLAQITGVTTSEAGVVSINNPVLFIFVVCIPLVGLGVGLLNRLIHTRG